MTCYSRLTFFLLIISQVLFCCSSSDNDNKSNSNDISAPEHFLSELVSDNHMIANVGDMVHLASNGPYLFEWSLLSMPDGSISALSDAKSSNPSIRIDVEGVYYLCVDAYQGDTYVGSDDVNISTASVIHDVRQGATGGGGDGSDWTNAYTSLPATLARGHTYYVADGNYGAYAAAGNERVLTGNPLNTDFSLIDATENGKSDLGNLYHTDMLGEIRGDDGVWDRGALAY